MLITLVNTLGLQGLELIEDAWHWHLEIKSIARGPPD